MGEDARWRPPDPAAVHARYEALLPKLRGTAMVLGYALAVHGSQDRDLDLVAVPWTDEAVDAQRLAVALCAAAEGFMYGHNLEAHPDTYDETRRNPAPRPHGRLAWSIHLGGGPYIDLSVMPRREVKRVTKIRDLYGVIDRRDVEIATLKADLAALREENEEWKTRYHQQHDRYATDIERGALARDYMTSENQRLREENERLRGSLRAIESLTQLRDRAAAHEEINDGNCVCNNCEAADVFDAALSAGSVLKAPASPAAGQEPSKP